MIITPEQIERVNREVCRAILATVGKTLEEVAGG